MPNVATAKLEPKQMGGSISGGIEAWEGEGGAASVPLGVPVGSMSGTAAQVEWAERIKRQVSAEFDRVTASFHSVAGKQGDEKRADTEAIISILEEQRTEVMSREQAGYFIRDWQEISDQVRQMISREPRYRAIKSKQKARGQCTVKFLEVLVAGSERAHSSQP